MGIELLVGALIAGVSGAVVGGVQGGFSGAVKGFFTGFVTGGIGVTAGASNGAFKKDSNNQLNTSPTYSFGPLQTQASNQLVRPRIYGKVKCAGNIIWQDNFNSSTIKRIVCFGDGEINGISDVRFNDIPVNELSGCSYTAYMGNGTQIIDSRVPGSTQQDKAQVVGGLKYDAYLAITAQASDKISGGFNVTAILEGSKIRVYSNLTTYAVEYSSNPAWCILDFLTCYNGCGISFDEIDMQSFLDAAEYCNQLVDEQPRFTLNIVLDTKKSRLDWLEDMLVCCRGYVIYQNGKISLKIEQSENTMQVFTPDNIITGSEKFWTTAREERYDIVKVQFVDPDNEYVKVYAQAEASVFQNEQPIVQEIEAFGVTNFRQASRLAWFYLNQAITCNKYISFQTTKEGLDRTVGDIIEVTSTFLGYTNKKMRIIHMAEAQEGQIEIVCKEYNPDLYNDNLGSSAPVYDIVSLGNPLAPPPDISNVQVSEIGWMNKDSVHISNIDVTWNDLDYKYLSHYLITYSTDNGVSWNNAGISYTNSYRIENAKTGDTYKVAVQAVNHQNLKSDKTIATPLTIIGKDDPPPDVATFTATADSRDNTKIILNWSKVNIVDLRGYEIREGVTWDAGTPITSLLYDTQEYTYTVTENRTYYFHIKAVDNSYNYSFNENSATLEGRTNPDDVQGFTALQNGANVLLSWIKSSSPDIIGYEIREGANFGTGTLVATGLANNSYQIPVDTEKIYQYHIKAVNRAGYYSINAATASAIVSGLPPKNVIQSYNEITLQNGTHSNTQFGQSKFNFSTLTGGFDDYPGMGFDDIGATTVLKLAKNGTVYYSSGTYTCARKDMGQVITATISSEFVTDILIESGLSTVLQFRTSTDGVNFTEWQDFSPILTTFRYIDFKVLLFTSDTTKTPEVNTFKEKIDVPDITKYGTTTIAIGGSIINYGHTYYTNPSVLPTAIGAGLRAEIQSIGLSSYTVKVLNSAGNDVGGQITWQSIGY